MKRKGDPIVTAEREGDAKDSQPDRHGIQRVCRGPAAHTTALVIQLHHGAEGQVDASAEGAP
jgi:hypothetical protein